MRTLTSTLLAAQKLGGLALYKAVFTKLGQSTKTYGVNTANIAIQMSHTEQEWSQKADVVVDNGDGTLTTLDLTGYTCTISYGYTTSAGDEYSACAPLEATAQRQTTDFKGGYLTTAFSCEGVFDMMNKDEASAEYAPDSGNPDTCKAVLTHIANATLAPFSHCKNYTITFDSEDSLIDTFKPADYLRVGFGESRLSAFKKVLGFTKCKARIEADGAIHVFNPTVSGSVYDYEYNDAVAYHNFFEKSVRNRLILPNLVSVCSHPDHETRYSGTATDSTSYAALGRYINEYKWLRLESNAQAALIATAILQGYQVGQERGHGQTPLNCGQEVLDYVKITDSAASDTRTGNIGYIRRICGGSKFEMEFRFGTLELSGYGGMLPGLSDIEQATLSLAQKYDLLYGAYGSLYDLVQQLLNNQVDITNSLRELWNRERVPRWHVTDQLIIPVRE